MGENLRSYKQLHRGTHLGLYDLERGTCLDEIALEAHGIGVVFSLFHAVPEVRAAAGRADVPQGARI